MGPNAQRKPINIEPEVLTAQGAELGLMTHQTKKIMDYAASNDTDSDTRRTFSGLESLGISPSLIHTPECYLYLIVLDDSGSIRRARAESDVLEAYNGFIKVFKEAKASGLIHSDVLVAVAGLNRGVIRPYCRIEDAAALTFAEYQADGEYTPLFDVTVQAHRLQMAKTTELALYGITARTGTLIVTDGQDNCSRLSAANVSEVVTDLTATRYHVIEGIYRGQADPSTFASMGIPPDWIRSGGESKQDLLNEFCRFSQASMSEFSDGENLNTGVTIG